MKPFLKILQTGGGAALMLSAVLLGGCSVFKQPYTTITYSPQTGVTPVAGAAEVVVKIEMIDSRSTKNKVSDYPSYEFSNAVGVQMTNSVPDVVKSAIETELTNRGFRLAESNVVVVVELSRFYNVFKGGFWSGSAVAQLNMNVQVKRPDGVIVFTRLVAAESTRKVYKDSEKNARLVLNAALENAMAKLFDDGSFADALLKAGHP